MNRDAIVAILRGAEAALLARGIHHAALFGSFARGEHGPHSAIDIPVDLDPDIVRTMFDYAGGHGWSRQHPLSRFSRT